MRGIHICWKQIFVVSLIAVISLFQLKQLHADEKQKPLKIVHFYSDTVGFWPLATAFGAAAAEDLNTDFQSYSFGNSPVTQIELITKILNDPKTKPDGFLFHNYKRRGDVILKIAQEANVPAIMFNAGPTEEDDFGNPREKYPLYLGLVTPDDEKAGYDLAQELITQARSKKLYGTDGKIHLCVMEGSRFSNAAKLRKNGLLRAINENPDVVADQFFDTNWRRERAQEAFRVAHERYENAKVFWVASDLMALGVLDVASSLNKKPGVDFIVGGIDLLPDIQSQVLDGNMAVSIGAHYTETVWALLMLHDYLRGCDFAQKDQTPIFKSTMMTLRSTDKPVLPGNTKQEILEWAKGIDFSHFSRCRSHSDYPLDASRFFETTQH